MISFIVATVGRPSLAATLASIVTLPGDEIIVVGNMPERLDDRVRYVPCAPGGDWGSTERNIATPLARGRYIAHIDDDDVYAPNARAIMAASIADAPERFAIFKMQYPDGSTLWADKVVRWGNVGTPMMLVPNMPHKLGRWGERQDCGDLRFLESMRWGADEIVWRDDVVAFVAKVH